MSVLWGASDLLMPVSHAARVREALPQARVTVWQGMGHHPQRERPQQLNRFLVSTTRLPARTLKRPTGQARTAERSLQP